MNSEILFRGKCFDTGEWVEGWYCGKTCDTPFSKARESAQIIDDNLYWHEVIRPTVCRYTGLTDKNGKKIFEGDIVCQYHEGIECEYLYEYRENIGQVFWHQKQARVLRTSKLFPNDCPAMCEHYEYEVIGNIHDNPELLGGD